MTVIIEFSDKDIETFIKANIETTRKYLGFLLENEILKQLAAQTNLKCETVKV